MKTQVLVKLDSSDKFKTVYDYYKNGWLKQATAYEYSGGWTERARVNFSYDEAGRRTAINNANGNGVKTDFVYNSRAETKSAKHWNAGKTTEYYGLTYVRDPGGNPLKVTYSDTSGVPTVYKNKYITYTYDALSRLTNETVSGSAGTSWSYDWVGNRQEDGSYNQVDELNAGSGFQYDKKGALAYDPSSTGDPRIHFQYGSRDLMTQIDREGSSPLNQTSMVWDADGQRLKLREEASYDSWQFLYDTAAGIPAVLYPFPIDRA